MRDIEELRIGVREGRHLAVDVRAGDEPVIVFSSGGGCTGLDWRPVMRELPEWRLVAYDRAGLGRSDAGAVPPTVASALSDLEHVVASGSAAGEMILVGHSLGGALVRAFAADHPHRVRALVLVDPRPEQLDARLPWMIARTHSAQPRPSRTSVDELPLALGLDARLTDIDAGGVRPLWLITHDPRCGDLLPAEPRTEAERETLESVWTELQQALVDAVPEGHLVVATDAGHLIPLEQPGLVAATIKEAVAATGRDGRRERAR